MPSIDTWPYFHLSRQLTYELLPQEESDDLFEVCVIVRPVTTFPASFLSQRFSRRRRGMVPLVLMGDVRLRGPNISNRTLRTQHRATGGRCTGLRIYCKGILPNRHCTESMEGRMTRLCCLPVRRCAITPSMSSVLSIALLNGGHKTNPGPLGGFIFLRRNSHD